MKLEMDNRIVDLLSQVSSTFTEMAALPKDAVKVLGGEKSAPAEKSGGRKQS
jgi:hypothetical protein